MQCIRALTRFPEDGITLVGLPTKAYGLDKSVAEQWQYGPPYSVCDGNSQLSSRIPARLHVSFTSTQYDLSFDFPFMIKLINQHVRGGDSIRQALDKALQMGRLVDTNALIQHGQNELWLICAVREDNLWLGFDACCTGKPDSIILRKRKREYFKCKVCKKRAYIFARLTPAVLSVFLTDPHQEREYAPVGEWICLKLPKYDKHPVWIRCGSFASFPLPA